MHFQRKTRKPSPPSTAAESTERLQLVHMDVVGELPVAGLNGEKYMLVLLDDFSHKCEARFFSSKAEVGALVQETLLRWEVATKCKVVTVRTDRGTEFVNYDLSDFFARKGITHQTSAPYSPQQNGKVERMNRVIKERVRALLFTAEAGPELWVGAARAVVRLLNISAVTGKPASPDELFYGRKPSAGHMKVWGCLAYVKFPDRQLTALGPRSVAGMFVGYEPGCKAYRVLVKGKIMVSKDVRFVEDELGYPTVLSHVPKSVVGIEGLFQPDGDDDEVVDERIERIVDAPREIAADPDLRADNLRDILLRARGVMQQLPADLPGPEIVDVEENEEEGEDNDGAQGQVDQEPEAGDNGGQIENEEEQGERGRGGGRYDLRERVCPPDKYVPGAYSTQVEAHAAVVEEAKMKASDLVIPKHIGEALSSPQKEYWKQAMQEELDAIEECDTYEVVRRPEGAKVIPLIWVYALKTDEFGDVIRFKARLVAQGCKQVEGVDCDQTFAPVSTHACRRVLLNIAAAENLEIHQVDIKTAFLNGELEEEVYVTQPPGFSNGDKKEVFRLKKALYGRKQAPRAWHKRLSKDLGEMGFKACRSDPALFMDSEGGDARAFIVTYVDDLLIICKSDERVTEIKNELKERFKVHDLGEVNNFLGSEVKRDREGGVIVISNAQKIRELAESFGISESDRGYSTPMCKSFVQTELPQGKMGEENVGSGSPLPEGHRYLELVGSLQYLANTTRPDICNAVSLLARYRANPTTSHMRAGLRIVRYLLGTKEMGLIYGGKGKQDLTGFVDSDFAGDVDSRKSTTGFVFMLNGGAVSWGSKKQQSVATSTVEAEFIAASHAIKEGVWLGSLLEELGKSVAGVELRMDNMGCIANLQNHVLSKYTKHISVCYHQAREKVAWGQVTPVYVNTESNVADIFTKPLPSPAFLKHRDSLRIG
jgi:hypothetical protein